MIISNYNFLRTYYYLYSINESFCVLLKYTRLLFLYKGFSEYTTNARISWFECKVHPLGVIITIITYSTRTGIQDKSSNNRGICTQLH